MIPAVALGLAIWSASARAEVAAHFTPAEAEVAFRAANEACMREDYKTCIEGYERLVDAGFAGADLQFNLGTAYLRQSQIGLAVLHLERALRLDPSDSDARANLEKARHMSVDKLVNAGEEAAGSEPVTSRVVFHTQGRNWSLAFLLLWTGGWLLLLSRRFISSAGFRGACLAAGLVATAASLPCAAVMAAHIYVAERAHDAIVVNPVLSVREGPDPSIKPSFEIHEGLRVRILDQDGAYRRVRLSNGLQGWVEAEGVVEIEPG
jgi:tetratricopeptide (TPR) repeat protein